MRVGWDLDGVEYDFAESVRRTMRYLKLENHFTMCEGEPIDWYFYRKWGMTDEFFLDICHIGADLGIIFAGDRRPGGLEAMKRVRDAGHTIHIVTDRSFGAKPEVSERLTKEFLSSHGYEYDTLTFSRDKTVVPTDYFIEDKIENYDALDAKGTKVYLVNRPWNLREDNRRRVDSVAEFANFLVN